MTRVLVVDDAPNIVRALVVNMKARGFEVDVAATGTSALAVAARHPPDVVILDLGLPDMDGGRVITSLRSWTSAPIIVLSGRNTQEQKVSALDAGADDYVTKPFSIEELFARVRAVSRRVPAVTTPTVALGDYVIDLSAYTVRRSDGSCADTRLTPTEWKILEILLHHPGRLVTKEQLLREVWGTAYDPESSSLRLYVAQLRRKLEPLPSRPQFLVTEPGMGYRFVPADVRQ